MMKTNKTKIVATAGPSCNTYEKLLALVHAGVNVFRLNCSHGTHEAHAAVIGHIRQINKEHGRNIAILADLQGPKLRIGELQDSAVSFAAGEEFWLTNEPVTGNRRQIHISYPNFSQDVRIGEKILLDDGKIEAVITEIAADKRVRLRVVNQGILLPRKGVNLPDTKISLPSLTEKDLADLHFMLQQQVDWIALSFVRTVADIQELRAIIQQQGSSAKIISKIEKPEALTDLRNIIIASDAVMVARGDLGVELPLEKIPMIQKKIVRMCIHRARPVIIATQMMESMIDRTRPNRSEITDVANAVLEGADAVMLSAETATGQYPELVIRTMSDIIREAEKEAVIYNRNLTPQPHSPSFLSDALCYNACEIAAAINAQALVGMTQSGYTGFMLSSYRPLAPVYIFTGNRTLVNQLSLSWGTQAFFYDTVKDIDSMLQDLIDILKEKKLLQPEDVIVSTASLPVAARLPTNTLKITRIS